jgi:arylsulfatase A-like enzyme
MLVSWKGVLPDSVRYKPMVSSMDIFTTALAAADAMLPARPVDGVDLTPYIFNPNSGYPHDYLFWQRGNSKAVRSNEWKLLLNDYSQDTLLYNLTDNRYEYPDVSALNPDIVDQLSSKIAAWQQTHAEPLWPSVIYFKVVKDGKEYYFEQ